MLLSVVILQDVFDAGTTYYTCLWNTLNLSSCQLICVKLSQKRQAVAISELIVIFPRHLCHPWQTMLGCSHDHRAVIRKRYPFQSSNFRPIWGKLGPTVLQRSIYTLLWQQQQRSLALNRSADWHRLTMINFSAGAVTGLPAPAQSRYSKRSSLSERSEPSESEYNLPPWRSRQTSFSSARILRS